MEDRQWWSEQEESYRVDSNVPEQFPANRNRNMLGANDMIGQQQYPNFGPQMIPPPSQRVPCTCPRCHSPSFQNNFNRMTLNNNYSIPEDNAFLYPDSLPTRQTRSRTVSQPYLSDSTSSPSSQLPNSPLITANENRKRKLATPEDPIEAAKLEKRRHANKKAAAKVRAKDKKLKKVLGNLDEQIKATESIEKEFEWFNTSELGAEMKRNGLNTETLISNIVSINKWFKNVKATLESKE